MSLASPSPPAAEGQEQAHTPFTVPGLVTCSAAASAIAPWPKHGPSICSLEEGYATGHMWVPIENGSSMPSGKQPSSG